MNNERIKKRREYVRYLILYTLAFIFLSGIIFWIFGNNGSTFVLMVDGEAQHFPVMCYVREYIRNLFTGKSLSLPMIDFSVGQGFDVIGTLNYYGFGDPLLLTTAFFPEHALEEMYAFIIFLHMYLAGIGFSCFIFETGKRETAFVLPGAIAYAFCNFVLYGGMKHPCFLNGVLYLPFLLMGVERMLKKKGILFLAVAAAFSFMSNYYFAYMNTVLAGIYLLIRLSGSYRKLGIKGFARAAGKLAGAYLLAVSLSGVIFLPAAHAFLNNARSGITGQGIRLLYGPGYYARTWQGLTESYAGGNNWMLPGIGAVGVVSLSILFVKHPKQEKRLLLGVVSLLLMLCFPVVGSIMNGFSYVTNRWSYGAAFLLAVLSVRMLSYLKDLSRKEKMAVFLLVVIYCIPLAVIAKWFLPEPGAVMNVFMILASAALFLVCGWLWREGKPRIAVWSISLIALVGVAWNMVSLYHENYKGFASEFLAKGKPEEKLEGTPLSAASQIEDNDFYRVERHWQKLNEAIYTGDYATNFYYSVIPKTMSSLYQSVWLSPQDPAHVLDSLDSRSALLALASVKYYVSGQELSIPYGYRKLDEVTGKSGQIYYLYENENPLPIGYTYDTVMSREDYEKLDPLLREQALLECAVVEEVPSGMKQVSAPAEARIVSREAKVESTHKAIWKNGILKVKKGGSMTLFFQGEPDCETYLVLEGISAEDDSYDSRVKVMSKAGSSGFKITGNNYQAYWEKEGQAVNLGYSREGQTECTISFPKARTYQIQDIRIQCVPMSGYSGKIRERKEESIQEAKVSGNQISGTIKVTTPKVLQLSVPYSAGWRFYANGEEQETFVSDLGYTGVCLQPGEYRIVMKYTSPWIIPGAAFSFGGVAFVLGYLAFFNRRKKRLKNSLAQ